MNVIEEAYELVDAIDSGDDGKVLEETGRYSASGGVSRGDERGARLV